MAEERKPPDVSRFEEYRRSGDVGLRNQLVEEHMNLARAFARRYANRGVAVEDLEQVGQLSLIGAVERFDPEVGVRFTTYAGRTIDGELKRHFRDKAWSVRVPRRFQDLGVAIRSTVDSLSKELGRSPTIPEVADAVGAEPDEVVAAMEAAQAYRADSIDVPISGDESTTSLADGLGASDIGPALFDDRELVVELLNELPDRERRIIELRFFAERSQREIAQDVGMSQMHVSRLLRKALATLREAVDDESLSAGGPATQPSSD
ncbi:MAG: SigB/SigF/SigG family RNA polymerase sigma factor [Acidimicrobiales bacterium]